ASRHRVALAAVIGILLCTSSSHAATWTEVAQFTGMGRISASYFFNSQTGFIGFNSTSGAGAVIGSPIKRTSDGGYTWTDVNTPAIGASIWVSDIWFRTPSEGWVTFFPSANSGKNLWHTLDGGLTWTTSG